MALKLDDLRPQDKWDEETTWEEVAAAMDAAGNPPLPKAWIRGLKSTHPDNASHACPTPAHFWRKYWKPKGLNDWRGMQSCLWTTLRHVTSGDPECHYGKDANIGYRDARIDDILVLLAGLNTGAKLDRSPTCTVISPIDRTRTEQRLETLDYNTTQANWDIQELRERLNSVKERTTTLEKKAARKRHQQERARREQEERERDAEALKRVEPVLSVVMMVPELMNNGMHGVVGVSWSHVRGKDGKAIFEFEGVNYELRRNKQNPRGGYTGHRLE